MAIALGIGIYLIVTTTLISKDGRLYIECAKQIEDNPVEAVRNMQPCPGYPLLISLMHRTMGIFSDTKSIQGWIFSAQFVSLLSKIIASVALYFVGCYFVGARASFWGVLILTILPDSAEFGSDALADWPHIMFLVIGFLLLLSGARRGKSWMFGFAGIIAGLAYLVRSEGCQLVLYGGAWLLFNFIKPQGQMKRTMAAGSLILLLAGFAAIAIPYMQLRGYVFPDQNMFKLPELLSFSGNINTSIINTNMCLAGLSIKWLIGDGTLITNMCETLMYYFFPALIIGSYCYFRKHSKTFEQTFFAAAFVIFNIAMLSWQSDRFLSRRHVMPLIIFTVFYIPIGLEVIAGWISEKSKQNKISMQKNKQRWFFILLIVGIVICVPKLLRPLGIKKQGYIDAAMWLKENTKPEDIIAAVDKRIAFYGERVSTGGAEYEIFEDIQYTVKFDTERKKSLNGNLVFNGADGVVNTNLTIPGESNMTISAWVKPNAAFQNGIIFSPQAWYNDFFFIRSINNKWYACLRWGTTTSYNLASESPYEAGKWYHIAGVADIANQTLELYVNGVLSNSIRIDSMGIFNNEFKWNIGGTTTQYFNGSIDNVMISNKALHSYKIEALYAGGMKLNGLSEIAKIIANNNISGCWRIDKESSMWIEEIEDAGKKVYEVFVDKRKNRGKKIVIYKK